MADRNSRVPENVPGRFYVNATCIDCDLCRETAPRNFQRNDEGRRSYVVASPADRRRNPPAWPPWRNAPSRPSAARNEPRLGPVLRL